MFNESLKGDKKIQFVVFKIQTKRKANIIK